MDKGIYLLQKVGIRVIKFFITLYLTFFSALIFTVITVIALLSQIFESVETPELTERAFTGTFHLLNDSIKGLDNKQLEAKLAEYKQYFPPLFDILTVDSLKFSQKEKELFNQYQIVTREDKHEYKLEPNDKEKVVVLDKEEVIVLHYYKIPQSSLLWQTNSDFNISVNAWMNVTITGNKMIKGMFYIAEELFRHYPLSQWESQLSKIQQVQKFPVRLVKLTNLAISPENLKRIKKGKIVNITQGLQLVTFAHYINNSPYVLIFEIAEVPWALYYALYILIFVIAFMIAIPIFLWVWPLWRNLSQLQSAAEDFGAGHYETRVPQSKYSRLIHLSQAFNAMAERTQRSIDSHKELTSAVSHELRTPVARMRFSLEMLSVSDNQQDVKRYVNDINTDIEELDLLLSELLTYARFDRNSSSMNFQPQNLCNWLDKSIKRLHPLAKTKQLKHKIIAIEAEEIAVFEPRLMSRVVDNLVQNALRYAKTTVLVTLTKKEQNYILWVEDDGEGIAEKEYKKLFDAFSRIDRSRDRSSGGFGLGLAIAKRVVEGHKGKISITDSVLGGAKFQVKWALNLKNTLIF